MRRINIFVLLCVLVFTMSACAWADGDIVGAPMVDHGDKKVVDTIPTLQVNNHEINFNDIEVPAHYNTDNSLAYWIGLGVKHEDNNKYYFGFAPYSNQELKEGNQGYKKDDTTYDTFYPGTYTTFEGKTAYLVVQKDEADTIIYEINFSNVKLKAPIIKTQPQTTSTVDFSQEDPQQEDEEEEEGQGASVAATPTEPELKLEVDDSKDYREFSYQWYKNTVSSTTGGSPVSGATNATYSVPVSDTTNRTEYYYCVVTAAIEGKASSGQTKSNVATVTFKGGTDPSPAPVDSGSGGGGGSGGGTGTGTGTETETSTTTDQAAEQLVENMDETVANSDAGKAMTEALQSGSQETKEAAVDVVSTLNDTLSTEEIAQLTTEEINSAVQNKAQETQDAAAEDANGGVVTDTTKPAGTDLIAKSETASEALKTANENLSVQPKVVTPTAATPEETEKTAQNLANVNESNLNDKDVDLDTVQAASENLKSAEDIEIDNADNDVALQAQKVEAVFDEVSENLAKAPNAGGGSGVVLASVLSRMRPTSTGFFQIKINLRNLTPGRKLKFWPSVAYFNAYVESRANSNSAQKASLADVSLASSEGDAFFLDADGNPVTKVAGNAANMSVVPYLEGGKDYTTAFITADATESDKAALEALAAQETTTEKSSSSSSSGGCELGLGLGALAAFMAFMKTSKKR